MKQFTQEQAQEMYAALEFVQEHCQLYGAGDAAREKIAAALAHTDAHPVAAPLSDLGNCDTCAFLSSRVFDEPCDSCSTETTPWSGWQPEIVTINPLAVADMADALGATLDQEAEHNEKS